MAESDDITLWKNLAEESKAGRLDLDPSIATDCLKACEDQLDVYKECQSLVKQAEHVTGLGDFPASDQLAKMLSLKAVGGEGNFFDSLKEHIEVLSLIRDTIKYSVDRFTDQDRQNQQQIHQG